MKNDTKITEFTNLEKRYSMSVAESSEQLLVVAQEKGELVLSYTYDKKHSRIVELEGRLGEDMKKTLSPSEQVVRLAEYVAFASKYYHPNSENNVVNRPQIKL